MIQLPRSILIYVGLFAFLFTGAFSGYCQQLPEVAEVQKKKDTTSVEPHRLILLPILFYTPETKTALGAGGVLTFHMKGDTLGSRMSNFQFGGVYTQLHQYAFYIPYQLYIKNDLYNLYGEISYYHFNYHFYGIGPEPPSHDERYGVAFPHFRLMALRRIASHLYGGLLYNLEQDRITHLDTAGLLIKHTITGSSGGRISEVGLTLKFDNRDDLFYPTKGFYTELSADMNDKYTGSDFNYRKYSLDMSTYYTTPFHHTLAMNFYSILETGNPPFMQMALLGGAKRMRGFYEGRFRDNDLAILQGEYRLRLFWRIGAAVFASSGYVADSPSQFISKDICVGYGMGLRYRLDRKQKVNIRADYGFTNIGDRNLYVTISEAF